MTGTVVDTSCARGLVASLTLPPTITHTEVRLNTNTVLLTAFGTNGFLAKFTGVALEAKTFVRELGREIHVSVTTCHVGTVASSKGTLQSLFLKVDFTSRSFAVDLPHLKKGGISRQDVDRRSLISLFRGIKCLVWVRDIISSLVMHRRYLNGIVGVVRCNAYTVATAVLGANTVLASTALPSRVADAYVLCDAFAVTVALVVAGRLRAVVSGPSGLAFALVGADALAVTVAHLALEEGGVTTVANGNGALGALPATPASANASVAITTVGTVVAAVACLAVGTGEASMAMTSEGGYADTPVGTVMRTGWFVAEFALVSGCAV